MTAETDIENVTFFTPSKFQREKPYPKKCVTSANNNFETKYDKVESNY